MRLKITLLSLVLLSSCASRTYTAKSVAEQERVASLAVHRGLLSRDEAARLVTQSKVSGKPATGEWSESGIERFLRGYEARLGRGGVAANLAYNAGRITEAQRLSLVAQSESVEANRRAAISASIGSTIQSMNQTSAIMNAQTQANYNTMLMNQPKTVTIMPTFGGGYTGTIR